MKDSILIYIENRERFAFFSRFLGPLASLGYQPVVLTTSPSTFLQLKFLKIPVFIMRRGKLKNDSFFCGDRDYANFHDVIVGSQTVDQAQYIFNITLLYCNKIFSNFNIQKCWIFNGSSTVAQAISFVARENSITLSFFEIANLPGKMLVDTEGVNAKSKIYKSIELLNEFDVKKNDFEKWKTEYLNSCLTPKQSLATSKYLYEHLIDWFGFCFWKCVDSDHTGYISRFCHRIKRGKNLRFKEGKIKSSYVLYPCQVNNDTQLTLNSNIGNLEAITIVRQLANELSLDLVVKLHPAERDYSHVKEIYSHVKSCGGILVAKKDTLWLIKNAKKIITINSSVGLMGLILGKDVVFLGDSIYSRLTETNLPKFIKGYLCDIDYFSTDEIEIDMIKRLIS